VVPEFEGARSNRGKQLVALPVDGAVTDRAAGVVPDGEVLGGHGDPRLADARLRQRT